MSAPAALIAATVLSTGLPALPPPPQMLNAIIVSDVSAAGALPLAAAKTPSATASTFAFMSISSGSSVESSPISSPDGKPMT
ncbi:hypothetical protein ACVOMV_23470 [Mesorhizobium atlanticum]